MCIKNLIESIIEELFNLPKVDYNEELEYLKLKVKDGCYIWSVKQMPHDFIEFIFSDSSVRVLSLYTIINNEELINSLKYKL